jgi:hypothetical protein
VLHGVASVVTDLTREPRRGSPGGGWWFRLRLAAEKRKKKNFGELGFLENFSAVVQECSSIERRERTE